MMMAPEGTAMFIGVTLVTSPFAFTVIDGPCNILQNQACRIGNTKYKSKITSTRNYDA
jgi:hypothetical protein